MSDSFGKAPIRVWNNLTSSLGLIGRVFAGLLGIYLVICLVLGWWWDFEPETSPVRDLAAQHAEQNNQGLVTGYTTAYALKHVASTLLDKRGGYLSNDLFPPGIWMDNVPNWEFGVLVQVRDMARAMRIDLSRSQSQSSEDPDLSLAEGQFFFDNSSWVLPATEDEYRKGIDMVDSYLVRLSDSAQSDAQFFARADNLQRWLEGVESRLGDLSQRLSKSVGKRQLNIDLAGDAAATQATDVPRETEEKTPFLEIDDVFYEARGQTWALLHLLRAVEHDFRDVLEKKNALISLQQIIRELEPTQENVWSPVILNGSGMGFLANHSLVMGSYVARANAALIDLRDLLARG